MTGKPTPVKRYHDYLLQTVTDLNVSSKWFVSPLNLGGVPGEDGGSGIPLAGVVGQLIQSNVAYDTTEASSLDVPASGLSLVHNLNRIRYWINAISGGGAITFLDLTDAPDDYSGYAGYSAVVNVGEDGLEFVNVSGGAGSTTFLDLTDTPSVYTDKYGYSAVVNVAEDGLEFINVSGGAGADTKKVMVSVDDTTEGYLEDKLYGGDFITITTITPGGNEQSRISASMSLDDLVNVTFTDIQVGDSLVYEGFGEWANVLVSGGSDIKDVKVSSDDTTAGYLEDKIVAGTNVTVTVLSPGGNETLSIASTASGGEGSAIDAYDEGISIASGITSLDWAGNQVSATASGTAVTVTISGIMVDAPEFVGCRTYRTTDYTTISGNTGWQNIDWQAEVYDTDSMWTTGGGHIIPSDGYYHAYGQVTFSGGLPTTNAMQVGLFDGSFPIGMSYNGYYSSSDQIITFPIAADWLYSTSDNINLKLVNHQGTEAILMSGIENSFLCTHKIQAVVADAEETPVCCNVYITGYDNDPVDDTWTELDWDAERYDTDTMYPGVDDNTIVINTAGYYNIVLNLMWHGLDETPFPIAQRIVLNDTNVLALTYDMSVDNNAARAEGCALLTSCDDELAVNDTITVDIWHNRGSTLSDAIRPGDGSSFITLHRIGPA